MRFWFYLIAQLIPIASLSLLRQHNVSSFDAARTSRRKSLVRLTTSSLQLCDNGKNISGNKDLRRHFLRSMLSVPLSIIIPMESSPMIAAAGENEIDKKGRSKSENIAGSSDSSSLFAWLCFTVSIFLFWMVVFRP